MSETDDDHHPGYLLHAGLIDKEDHSDRSQGPDAFARRSGCQYRTPAGERESASKDPVAETARASAKIEKRILRYTRAFLTAPQAPLAAPSSLTAGEFVTEGRGCAFRRSPIKRLPSYAWRPGSLGFRVVSKHWCDRPSNWLQRRLRPGVAPHTLRSGSHRVGIRPSHRRGFQLQGFWREGARSSCSWRTRVRAARAGAASKL
jgi:hypothetical protein